MSWSVEVQRDGENVVTISDRTLSGRDISEDDADLIRQCAEHLLSFVGPKGQTKFFTIEELANES